MSAKDQIAAMLNELMGPRRNEESDPSGLSFRDNDVCKYFLAGFCPHEMFTNTKADLGKCACNLIHDESLRVAYKQSESYGKMGYERQLYNFIKKLYDDMRRKIQRNKERLELTQSDALDPASKEQLTSRIRELEQEIAKLLSEAEQHGATGAIAKSQECTEQAEKLTEEKEDLRKSLVGALTRPGDTGAKPMEVCETCACFLIIGDVQQRIDEHMAGKQHVGFAKIAETIKELEDKFKKDEEERYSGSMRGRDRDERGVRSRERSRSRDRREHRRDSRDQDRHRDRDRDRSRRHDDDRKNGHSEKSRHRRSRSRSRDRKRSRSRDRKSSRGHHRDEK